MKVKALVFDEHFIKNISNDLLNNLINLKEPIPMWIQSVVLDYFHDFNNQRLLLFGDDEEFIAKVREERLVSRKLPPVEAREYHNDLALDFIKRHPEFAPFIKEVKYLDV